MCTAGGKLSDSECALSNDLALWHYDADNTTLAWLVGAKTGGTQRVQSEERTGTVSLEGSTYPGTGDLLCCNGYFWLKQAQMH